jgi:hypothetical protein
MKASIATVEFSAIEIQGLLSDGGDYGVGVPQFCNLFSIPSKNAKQNIQSLLGIERGKISILKWKTTLHASGVNVLTVLQFEQLVKALMLKGNVAAIQLGCDCIAMSLTQRFADAFNRKFDKDDRDTFFKARVAGVVSRRSLTDAIRDWMNETGNQDKNLYASITNQIYTRLFGGDTDEMRKLIGIPKDQSIRDNLHPKALKAIDNAEDYIAVLIDDGSNPTKAVSMYFNSPFVKKVAI